MKLYIDAIMAEFNGTRGIKREDKEEAEMAVTIYLVNYAIAEFGIATVLCSKTSITTHSAH